MAHNYEQEEEDAQEQFLEEVEAVYQRERVLGIWEDMGHQRPPPDKSKKKTGWTINRTRKKQRRTL